MEYQAVFERYEIKYILTRAQKEKVLQAIAPYMSLDQYGRSTIRNIYFDTDNYRLIRRSIDNTGYKEKLRIRSYHRATPESTVFVELKKKYRSIVSKRRISLSEEQAMAWMQGAGLGAEESQISNEIDYFMSYYKTLRPTAFLSYERKAYYAHNGSDFRITFDDTILCRQEDICLESDIYGTPLLPADTILMEIKCAGGIPLWMTQILSEEKLYKTSFSKYGTAYQTLIFPQIQKEASTHAGIII